MNDANPKLTNQPEGAQAENQDGSAQGASPSPVGSPKFPGLRLLKLGEILRPGDRSLVKGGTIDPIPTWKGLFGLAVAEADMNDYFRPLTSEASTVSRPGEPEQSPSEVSQ
jgi:hypothetical protein